jgi:hypothetical protein
LENTFVTKLLEKRIRRLQKLKTQFLFLLCGDCIEDKNLRELWKRSGLSIEEVAFKMCLSYERTSHILYGEPIGRKVRVRFIRFFQNELNNKS